MKTIKFKKLLSENISGRKLIVVDIQPIYEAEFKRFKYDFLNDLINFEGEVLYLYNGPDMGYNDDERSIEEGIRMETDEWEADLDNITFVEKGYGFFRDAMDRGFDEDDIITLIRGMLKHRKSDVRDIDVDDLNDIINDEYFIQEIADEHTMLYLPQFDVNILKRFGGANICGGGKDECLAEIQVLLEAMKIRTKVVRKYVY